METKKNPRKDVYRLTSIWFNVGLILSISAVIMAFEWKSIVEPVPVDEPDLLAGQQLDIITPTKIPPPPKPKPIIHNPEEVSKEEVVVDLIDITIDPPIEIAEPPILEGLPEDDEPIEVFDYVEQLPEPVGGFEAFYNFIGKNLNYPAPARRMDVQGKVFVQFIVDEEGNISDLKIVRGIGAGCDEEVLRVMEKAPKWIPGKQRAVPVKVRMVIPIHFQID